MLTVISSLVCTDTGHHNIAPLFSFSIKMKLECWWNKALVLMTHCVCFYDLFFLWLCALWAWQLELTTLRCCNAIRCCWWASLSDWCSLHMYATVAPFGCTQLVIPYDILNVEEWILGTFMSICVQMLWVIISLALLLSHHLPGVIALGQALAGGRR